MMCSVFWKDSQWQHGAWTGVEGSLAEGTVREVSPVGNPGWGRTGELEETKKFDSTGFRDWLNVGAVWWVAGSLSNIHSPLSWP